MSATPHKFPEPYFSDAGARIYCGDCMAVLPQFPAKSVHLAMTSPPYFSLLTHLSRLRYGSGLSFPIIFARLADLGVSRGEVGAGVREAVSMGILEAVPQESGGVRWVEFRKRRTEVAA